MEMRREPPGGSLLLEMKHVGTEKSQIRGSYGGSLPLLRMRYK